MCKVIVLYRLLCVCNWRLGMSKDLKNVFLLDVYAPMLTDKQREVMELYYYEDFSLSEIAEHARITRQAVRDSIKKAEMFLSDAEMKLCVAGKLTECRKAFDIIKARAEEISRCSDINNAKKISSEIIEQINNIWDKM